MGQIITIMRNKIVSILSSVVIGLTVGLPFLANAQFDATTTGTAIDEVSGVTYGYFGVLIEKFWPFLLGAVILVGVIAFGKRIIHSMWGK